MQNSDNLDQEEFEGVAGEDIQLADALKEYAATMDDSARKTFMTRLQNDEAYYLEMGKALSEMAMLIAGAAVIDDEAEYGKFKRKILFDSRADSSEVKALRTYYLAHRDEVDMDAVIDGTDSQKRFEARLADFFEAYKNQHPA